MKNILYFDASNGVAGDMFVGALIDLGADFNLIKADIDSLGIDVEVICKKTETYGIAATKFSVIDSTTKNLADSSENHHHQHRHLNDIIEMINNSTLNDKVKNDSVNIFKIIATAEAEVHGYDIEKVHFHEVGALDSIADIVAAAGAMNRLCFDIVYSSALNLGSGTVKCQHGELSVPAPAVLKIAEGMQVYSDGIKKELTTPTGAAIIKYYASEQKDLPKMTVGKSGNGAGTRDIGRPNIFRVIIGKTGE